MKLINVIDENGKSYSSTYVKRAKGLVKHDRAYWVDDSTICLRVPLKQMEEKIMKANDFERMIALTVAGNYAIRNKNKEDYHLGYSAIKALCDTYDGMITELEKANIEISPGLEKICFDSIPNNKEANKLRELEQCVFTKNCLLNPILKLEQKKLENGSKTNSSFESKVKTSANNNKIVINMNSNSKNETEENFEDLKELLEELEELKEELEELKEEGIDLKQELEEAKEELDEFIIDAKELEIDIKEIKMDIKALESDSDDQDEEELEELREELVSKEEELMELKDDIESTKQDIEDLKQNIEDNKLDIEDVEQEIEVINEEIQELSSKLKQTKK